MWTECSPALFEFAPVESHAVVAGFDGGAIASDAGGLPLGSANRAAGLVERFAACFTDARAPDRVEHGLATLVGRRRFGRPTAWPPSPVGTPSAINFNKDRDIPADPLWLLSQSKGEMMANKLKRGQMVRFETVGQDTGSSARARWCGPSMPRAAPASR